MKREGDLGKERGGCGKNGNFEGRKRRRRLETRGNVNGNGIVFFSATRTPYLPFCVKGFKQVSSRRNGCTDTPTHYPW